MKIEFDELNKFIERAIIDVLHNNIVATGNTFTIIEDSGMTGVTIVVAAESIGDQLRDFVQKLSEENKKFKFEDKEI